MLLPSALLALRGVTADTGVDERGGLPILIGAEETPLEADGC